VHYISQGIIGYSASTHTKILATSVTLVANTMGDVDAVIGRRELPRHILDFSFFFAF